MLPVIKHKDLIKNLSDVFKCRGVDLLLNVVRVFRYIGRRGHPGLLVGVLSLRVLRFLGDRPRCFHDEFYVSGILPPLHGNTVGLNVRQGPAVERLALPEFLQLFVPVVLY